MGFLLCVRGCALEYGHQRRHSKGHKEQFTNILQVVLKILVKEKEKKIKALILLLT